MAQRRMFNKSITNSSKFLKMPMSSRLLYYDLGMNADDDGFVEHFMVLRMTGASEQDLGVLEINGLVKVFDENVLWIKDWKENNYIQKDRYIPSKYLGIYNVDTICIQDVYTGKDSIGKISIDNIKEEINKEEKVKRFKPPTLEEIEQYIKEKNMNVNPKTFYEYFTESKWTDSKGNKVKNWKQKLITWNSYNKKEQKEESVPNWFGKENQKQDLSSDDVKEIEDLLNDM